MSEERKTQQQADQLLRAYAKELDAHYSVEAEAFLQEDPDYPEQIKKHGRRRYTNPTKRILRYAAILLIALFAASIVVPVPQASAWRIWWLDLLTGETQEDVKTKAENEYDFVDYYPGKIPEGFELVEDKKVGESEWKTVYENAEGKYIQLYQSVKNKGISFSDNEKSEIKKEVIGDVETFITHHGDNIVYRFTTEKSVNEVHTNAGYEVGKEFIENLQKK